MSVLHTVLTIIIILSEFSLKHSSVADAKPAADVAAVALPKPFPYEKGLVGFAFGTLVSRFLEKLLHLGKEDNAKCALSITNKMTSMRLVNPYLYIEHGESSMPVPLKVVNDSAEILFQAAADNKDTSGLLFYEIENTAHYLLIFWKITGPKTVALFTPNRFHVDIIPATKFFDSEAALKQNYLDNKAYSSKTKEASDFTILERTLLVPGRPVKDKLTITIRAQMTMMKEAEYMVEIMDNLSPATASVPQLYRRGALEITIGMAVVKLATDLTFKKLMKSVPSEQTGTISLENASKEITLSNPSWYIVAGLTSTIVPWEVKPSETGEVSYSIPILGTNIKDAFKHTVYFLSYQITGTDYYIIIGTWFPWKMEMEKVKHREQGVFTLFVLRNANVNIEMKNTLKAVGEGLRAKKGNLEELNKYLAGDVNSKYIYDNIPTGKGIPLKIQGVRATKFETYREWQYPVFASEVVNKQRKEYYVKIAAAVGVGKSSGVTVRVEVVPGQSPDAAKFLNENPQIYKEPPKEVTSVSPLTLGLGSEEMGTSLRKRHLKKTPTTSAKSAAVAT